MTKIEPMSVEEIKELMVVYLRVPTGSIHRLILAWIHAEARARYWEMDRHTKHTPALDDLIVTVKKEVGWPEDK